MSCGHKSLKGPVHQKQKQTKIWEAFYHLPLLVSELFLQLKVSSGNWDIVVERRVAVQSLKMFNSLSTTNKFPFTSIVLAEKKSPWPKFQNHLHDTTRGESVNGYMKHKKQALLFNPTHTSVQPHDHQETSQELQVPSEDLTLQLKAANYWIVEMRQEARDS